MRGPVIIFLFHDYSCSNSTRTPLQSLGWRNITGFPWAPILGSALKHRIFLLFTSATAAWMSLTSIQMWWMPPALFFSRYPAMGDFSPRGCNNSSFVLDNSTKTVVTPCSGRSWRGKMDIWEIERIFCYLGRADGGSQHVSVQSCGSLQVWDGDGDMVQFTQTPLSCRWWSRGWQGSYWASLQSPRYLLK